MTRLLVIGFLLAVLSVPATVHGGTEPTGFAGVPWGAASDDAMRVAQERCAAAYTVTNTPGSMTKVFCTEYQLDGITAPVTLGLEFIDDTLQGYMLVVPRKEATAFGEALIDKFGNPRATGPCMRLPLALMLRRDRDLPGMLASLPSDQREIL